MKPCRYCGGEADEKLHAQKLGYVCRSCVRIFVYHRNNHYACSDARKRRYNARVSKRRVTIGTQCMGYAASIDHAKLIRDHIKRRRRDYVTQQGFSRRAEAQGAAASAVPVEAEL